MELGKTFTIDFVTNNPTTGGAVDADSTPDVRVFEDNNDVPIYTPLAVKRGAFDGNYRVSIEATIANGFEKDKSYNAVVTATVGGVIGRQPISSFFIEDTMEKLTSVAATIDVPPIPDSFVPTINEFTEEEPLSMDDKFGADSEYEFQDEYIRGYDTEAKAWKEDSDAPDDVKAEVTAWQEVINVYDAAKLVYDDEYSLQRTLQWKAYVAEKLLDITE